MQTHIKDTRIFFKVLFYLLVIAPLVINEGVLFINSTPRATSPHFPLDMIQSCANDYMAKRGDKYFAFDLIRRIRERDPYIDPLNDETTLAKLFIKYPDMREEYLRAVVEGILDSKTTNFNRIQLLGALEKNTHINFREVIDKAGGYDNQKSRTQKGIQNVVDWWAERLRKNAMASIAATEKDYKFPPPPRWMSQGH